jgi:hypothetical protein
MSCCCEEMKKQISFLCSEHSSRYACPDCVVEYNEKFDEYGLIIHDGGSSMFIIQFCPWCGTKLPESKRALWFERIEALGLDLWNDPIPEPYKSGAWWQKENF